MNIKKYSWLAVLPMVFTACQDDMLVETSSQGITTLTASMGEKAADSRAQIVLNGTNKTKEIFHWNEGDAFTVFQLMKEDGTGLSSHRFSIADAYSDDEPTASADFSTSDEGLSTGRNFVAFYPAPVMDEGSLQNFHLTLDNTLPDNTDESWVDYFSHNMFMQASGTVSETTGVTGLTFKHLCGIIRISYFNDSSTDRTISRIDVDGSFGTSYGYQLGTDCSIWESMGTTGNMGITFENGATVASGETANFYILFMDSREPEENKLPLSVVRVNFADGTGMGTPVYSQTLPLFQVGKSYWLNVTDNGNELFWTNDQQGGTNNPDEGNESVVCDASTFDDLKKALASPQEDGKMTDIQILADITLTEPLTVNKPVNLIMKGNTLTLGYTLLAGEGAIINNSDLYIRTEGIIEAPSTGTEVDAYLFKSGSGMLYFGNVTVNAGIVKNVAYIKDGKGRVYLNAVLNASGYTLDIESDSYSDVDIYTGTLNGNVRWKLNSAEYTNLCRFGAGPNSTINGDLVWAGEYGGTATGYRIEFGSPVNIGGANWVTTNGSEGDNSGDESCFEVSDFEGLKKAIEQATDEKHVILFKENIVMTEPLTINKRMTWNMDHRTLFVGENFKWDSAEAAITATGSSFNIDYGTILGTTAIVNDKYLIKFSGSDFGIHEGSELSSKGIEHALLAVDARVHIDNSVIQASQDSYAVNVLAKNKFAQLYFHQKAYVNGVVGFTADYKATEPDMNHISVQDGSTITGGLDLTGSYKSEVDVDTNGGNVNGDGWLEAGIMRLQNEFTNYGRAGIEVLALDGQTVTFTVGTTNGGSVNFDTRELQGSGTIKFVNPEETSVTVYINIDDFLSSSVDFEFEGNFLKMINAKTDRVKEFFEMGRGADQITLWLSGDVSLEEQIVIDSSMSDGSEDGGGQGHLFLMLEGHTITSELDVPAIVVQGGFFTVSGNGKTCVVKSKTEFIQIGAGADASNNGICLMMRDDVTFNIESDTWVYVNALDASLTSHKNFEIYINSDVLTDDEKKAKVRMNESYKCSSFFIGG